MTPRERFLAVMNFERVDRALFVPYFGVWPETWERWKREGLGDHHWTEPFGFDVRPEHAAQFAFVPVNGFVCPAVEARLLERRKGTVVMTDEWGVTKEVRDDGQMTHYLAHPVIDRRSWEAYRREYLRPDAPGRFPDHFSRLASDYSKRDYVLGIGGRPIGFFAAIRELMGAEAALAALLDAPDLVLDMAEHLADLWIEVFGRVLKSVQPDFLFIWELICDNRGPMFSPEVFRDIFLPPYRRFLEAMRNGGVKHIWFDCQGDVLKLLPLFLEAGATGSLPVEVNAGMDVREFRRLYPRLELIGGIRRAALVAGPDAIDHELERVAPVVRRGGYIPAIDHYFSPDISWDNFRHFVDGLRRLTHAPVEP